MNTQKYVIGSLAAAVWLMLYGFIVNTFILAGYWEAHTNPALWRAEGEEMWWAMILSVLLQGFALGYIFTRGYEAKGIGEGVRFGVLIAWFIAAIYFMFYALQPWELGPTIVAIINDGIMYIGAGVVLGLTYRK